MNLAMKDTYYRDAERKSQHGDDDEQDAPYECDNAEPESLQMNYGHLPVINGAYETESRQRIEINQSSLMSNVHERMGG